MKYLAVIPARGGSKRLPRKNILPLADLPLIAWSIRGARESEVFRDVLVSTDDEEIADVARRHDGHVPWLRPPELATDTATAVDVLVHAVQAYEDAAGVRLDGVMLLQPTSPFRRPETIREAVSIFRNSGGMSVVGVSPAATHPYWCLKVDADGCLQPFAAEDGLSFRSQDLPPVYEVNGSIYLVSAEYLKSQRALYTKPFRPIIMADPIECIDIDTPYDWGVAESFAAKLKG